MTATATRPTGTLALAALVVLGSGGLLVAAGSLAQADERALSTVLSVIAGIATPGAFYIASRSHHPRPGGAARSRGFGPVAAGLGLMLLSGATMFAAGYVGADGHPLLALPLIGLGGAIILVAYMTLGSAWR